MQRSEAVRRQQAQAEKGQMRKAQAVAAAKQRQQQQQQQEEEDQHVRQQLQALFSLVPAQSIPSASDKFAAAQQSGDQVKQTSQAPSPSAPREQRFDPSEIIQQVIAAALGAAASTAPSQEMSEVCVSQFLYLLGMFIYLVSLNLQAATSSGASSSTDPAHYTYAAPASAQFLNNRAGSSSGLPASEEQRRSNAATEAQQIMQAIRASLDPANDVKPPQPSSAVAPTAPVTSDRGRPDKGKEPVRIPLRSPSPQIHTIESIEAEFVNLSYGFQFPSHVDFAPSPSDPVTLAYSQANGSIHAYEQALNGLLTKLDAVETLGVAEVRAARKELVKRIEGALEKLDADKAEAWKKANQGVQEGDVEVKGYDVEFVEPAVEAVSIESVSTDQDSAPTIATASSPLPLDLPEADAAEADTEAVPEETVLPETSIPSIEPTEPIATPSYPASTASFNSSTASAPKADSQESDTESSTHAPSPRGENAEFIML